MAFRKDRFVFKRLIIGANPNGFGGALDQLWSKTEAESVITTRRKPSDENQLPFEVKVPRTKASVEDVIKAAEPLQEAIDALEEKPSVIVNAIAGGGGLTVDKALPFRDDPEGLASSPYVKATTLISASVAEVVARANQSIPNVAVSYEPFLPTGFHPVTGETLRYTKIEVTYPPRAAKAEQEQLAAGQINTTFRPEDIQALTDAKETATAFSNKILSQVEDTENQQPVDNLHSIKVMFEAETDSTGIFPEMGILSCTRFFGGIYAKAKASPGQYPEWEKVINFLESIPEFETIKDKLLTLFGDKEFVDWLENEATYGDLADNLSRRLSDLGITRHIGYIRLMNAVISDAYKTVLPHAIDEKVQAIEAQEGEKVSHIYSQDLLKFENVKLEDSIPKELPRTPVNIMGVDFFTQVDSHTYQVPFENVVLNGHFVISPGVFLKELVEKRFGRNFNESSFRGALKPLDVITVKSNKSKDQVEVYCNGKVIAEFSRKETKAANLNPHREFSTQGLAVNNVDERLPHSEPFNFAGDVKARIAQINFYQCELKAQNIPGVTDYESVPFNLLVEQGMQAAGGILMQHFDKNNIVVTTTKTTEEHRRLRVAPGETLKLEFRGKHNTRGGMYEPEVVMRRGSDDKLIFAGSIKCGLG